METKNRNIAYVYLFATFFLWGSVYVVSKAVMGVFSPPLVACFRYVVAIIPLAIIVSRKERVRIDRADWKLFIAVGALGYYLTIVLNMYGIQLAGASMSSLINSLTPVTITVIAAFVLRERIGIVKILCLVLALVGTYIVTTGSTDNTQLLGILLSVVAVLCWSFTSVFMRKLTKKYPPLIVTTYAIAIGLIFHLPTAAVTIVREGGLHLTWSAALWMLYLGLAATALPQFCWSKSLSMLEASTCSLFYPLQPFSSVILGSIFLGETFQPSFFIGSALIVLDVVLNCLFGQRPDKPKENAPATPTDTSAE